MAVLTILGGGPAGLGTAFYAHRAGVPFVLLEKSAHLGGLCQTLRCGDHLYDCGAHRFHDRDDEITRDVRGLLGDELVSVDAPSKVYDGGRFIDFPPTPLNLVFSSLSLRESARIGLDLIRSRLRKSALVTFEDFAVSQFGETLARRVLLNYSEKVWGLPASRLSPDVATVRLRGMTLTSLFLELLLPNRKTAHIDGKFLYPLGGYGRIIESLAATLPAQSVHAGREINGLECDRKGVRRVHFARHPPLDSDGRIVSTLPLTLLVRLLGDRLSKEVRETAAALRFRHIRLLFLRLAQPRVSTNASIYIPQPEFCVARAYEPKNRSPRMAPAHETSLLVEVPCFDGDTIYSMDVEGLARRVVGELDQVGIVEPGKLIEWRHHFLPNAYPVYSLNYSDQIALIMRSLAAIPNLGSIGRAGSFFYSHLHNQLRFGKEYVKSLAEPGPRQETSEGKSLSLEEALA
ncbi:MAG: FAD-dependent oxidoreductase [Candidatus Binataceae bacterium]